MYIFFLLGDCDQEKPAHKRQRAREKQLLGIGTHTLSLSFFLSFSDTNLMSEWWEAVGEVEGSWFHEGHQQGMEEGRAEGRTEGIQFGLGKGVCVCRPCACPCLCPLALLCPHVCLCAGMSLGEDVGLVAGVVSSLLAYSKNITLSERYVRCASPTPTATW